MRTYLIPIINAQGQQSLLRVKATSLSDARIRASALTQESGSTISGNPTQVLNEDGSVNPQGISSIRQNFPNLFSGNSDLSDADIVGNISAFPTGGVGNLLGGEDPGGAGFPGGGEGVGVAGSPAGGSAIQGGEDLFPFGSFLQAAQGRGLDPEGQFGTSIRRQFDPLSAASSLAGIVSGLPQDSTSFEKFFGQNIGRGGQVASEALRNLFAGNLGSNPLAATRQQELLNPDVLTDRGRGDISTLRQLGRSAAGAQFSPFVARNLLPSSARVSRDLQSVNASGGFGQQGNASFQDFLRKQFGLNF